MKKILNTLLVLAIILVQIVPTTFAKADAVTGSITVEKAVVGETYSVYKILTLETFDKTNNHYIYRVDTDWTDFVTSDGVDYLEVVSVENGASYVTWKGETTDSRVQEFAKKALAFAESNSIAAVDSKTAEGTTVEFTGLSLGYYLVNTSLNNSTDTFCNLTTTDKDVTIYEKNTNNPTLDKLVKEDSTGTFGKTNSAKIGDVVEYKTTITTGSGVAKYVLNDTMEAGLKLNASSITVTVNDATVASGTDTFSITSTDTTYKITFVDAYILNLPLQTDIVVTYNATLLETAEVCLESAGATCESNDNTATLNYEKETTEEVFTKTYTYEYDIVKTDAEDVLLDGAEFKLYDGKNAVKFNVNGTTYTVSPNGTTDIIVVTDGKVTIVGLDLDSYSLEETKAPEGYNPLTSNVEFTVSTTGGTATITDGAYVSGGVRVINNTGALLPSTGGIGTLLFVTIGSLITLAFGVLLVAKLRMSKISA